jgi:hypothetical protein
MPSSSYHNDLPTASSSDSEEDHPVASAGTSDNECTSNNDSTSNSDGDSQIEGDDQVITCPKSTLAKNCYTGRRNPTKRSSGRWLVEEIDLSGAPVEPPLARKKFRTVCGCVARDRVNINYRRWKELTSSP